MKSPILRKIIEQNYLGREKMGRKTKVRDSHILTRQSKHSFRSEMGSRAQAGRGWGASLKGLGD